jgi:hypothetical protein
MLMLANPGRRKRRKSRRGRRRKHSARRMHRRSHRRGRRKGRKSRGKGRLGSLFLKKFAKRWFCKHRSGKGMLKAAWRAKRGGR